MNTNIKEIKNYRSIKQMASGGPFSEAALRWLVFNAESNGLAAAIVRIGRKVLIDSEEFATWIDGHRSDLHASASKRGSND